MACSVHIEEYVRITIVFIHFSFGSYYVFSIDKKQESQERQFLSPEMYNQVYISTGSP